MTKRRPSNKDSGENVGRKAYVAPRILSRERLESAANVCGSSFGIKSEPLQPSPGGGTCGQVSLQS